MGGKITPREWAKELMESGMSQGQWDCLMILLRFGVKSELILHIAEIVKNMRKPRYFECEYFQANDSYNQSIPEPIMTEEDYQNLRYSENELHDIYRADAYDGGKKFIQIAYIVYLLAAGVEVHKIAIMFKAEELYIKDIQDKMTQQVPSVYPAEEFICRFWEEKIYTMIYQTETKLGRLQSTRQRTIGLLNKTRLSLADIADTLDIPIDSILLIMQSIDMKQRYDIPRDDGDEEKNDGNNSKAGEGTTADTVAISKDD